MRQALIVVCGICAVALASGCGSGEGGGTIKAAGKVTVKGQPMADLVVTFTPETGRPAAGETDGSGQFTLSTFRANDGAVPGAHKVSITEKTSESNPMPGTPEYAAWAQKPPKFDSKYSDPNKSGLTATVKAGEDNTKFNFDLK
jgi:hypothetical protein